MTISIEIKIDKALESRRIVLDFSWHGFLCFGVSSWLMDAPRLDTMISLCQHCVHGAGKVWRHTHNKQNEV